MFPIVIQGQLQVLGNKVLIFASQVLIDLHIVRHSILDVCLALAHRETGRDGISCLFRLKYRNYRLINYILIIFHNDRVILKVMV